MPEEKDESLTLDKRTMDVLVAHVIPTSKYFEARFDHMQDQIDRINTDLRDFRGDVDKRFEQVIASIDRLADKLDHRDERQRTFTLRMFTIAISISVLGALGVFLKSLGGI
ncbi:MAG: hypothetical protein BA873_04315 [Desulfobulbaceae bacterium C00003063]|nr:MAG: hypothetical protein BA873_04315 [Desulfobulbaceae bacterium C00003063]